MGARLELAWRNARSHPGRSFFTAAATALGVGMVLSSILVDHSLRLGLSQAEQTLSGNADVEVLAFDEHGFSPDMVDAVKKVPGVSASSPLIRKRLNGLVSGKTVAFEMVGVDPTSYLHPLELTEGATLSGEDSKAVLLDASWAKAHKVHVAQRISLFTADGSRDFVVKGLTGPNSYLGSAYGAVIVVPLGTAKSAFRLGAKVTQISVKVKPDNCYDPDCAKSAYNSFRRRLALVATDDYSLSESLTNGGARPLAEIEPLLVFFGMVPLISGLLLIYNNVAVSIAERRRDIGLLRAAGATSSWIRGVFLAEAALVGTVGSIAGCFAGFLIAFITLRALGGVSGTSSLQLYSDVIDVAEAFTLGLCAMVLAAFIPAHQASRLAPAAALRPAKPFTKDRVDKKVALVAFLEIAVAVPLLLAPAGKGFSGGGVLEMGMGVLLMFVGIIALTPAILPTAALIGGRLAGIFVPREAALAANSLARRPALGAPAMASLVASATLIISVSSVVQGANAAGEGWVKGLFASDRVMVSPIRQPDSIRQAISGIPGVSYAAPVAYFKARDGMRALDMAAIDPLAYAQEGKAEFISGTGANAYAKLEGGRSVILPRRTADALKLTAGSSLELSANGVTRPYTVAGVVRHSFPGASGGESVLISRGNSQGDFGVVGFNLLEIGVDKGVGGRLDARLTEEATRYGMSIESVQGIAAGVDKGLASFLAVLSVGGLAGALLGLFAVANTVSLHASESRREYGLLRAVGLTRKQLRRLILTQAGILAGAGATFGVLGGLALGWFLSLDAASPGFPLPFTVPVGGIFALVLSVVIGAVLASVLPARKAAGESVVASLRYE